MDLQFLFRSNKEHDCRKKQHRLRIQWEEEKCKRELEKNELEKEYRKNLTAKRRKENDECQKTENNQEGEDCGHDACHLGPEY